MTHNEKRSNSVNEALAALISGFLYGATTIIVGHPFDTIKTKMQVQVEFATKNLAHSTRHIYKSSGFIGFYRGCTPPLIGASLYRSSQFAIFEGLYTKLSNHKTFIKEIPYCFGLQIRVLFAGFVAGSIRAIIECPFEYSKVQGQIGEKWKIKNVFQGFKLLWLRSSLLLSTYFSSVDIFRRKTNFFKTNAGLFVMNGTCSVLAWLSIWPLEIVKNQIQSQNESNFNKRYKIVDLLRENINKNGILNGFSRGSIPGLTSVFIRSGAAMIVMQYTQIFLTKVGLRN